MFTELGSKSLAANNYRINEDPETTSAAIVANACILLCENTCMLNVISDNGVCFGVYASLLLLLLVLRGSSVTLGSLLTINQFYLFWTMDDTC